MYWNHQERSIVGQISDHIICTYYNTHIIFICTQHCKHILIAQFQLQCYGQKLTPNKFVVTKEVQGPHKRAIWYSEEEQLFMPRTQRNLKDNNNKMSDDNQEPAPENSSNEPTYVFTDIPSQLHDEGWKSALSDHMASDTFQSLLVKIRSDANTGATIYPPPQDVFAAFNLCPLQKVKVVIVGQDPYHGPGQAQGLAFSIRQGIKAPPSLRNIFKEAMSDVGIDDPKNNGNLEGWAKQGVLLLNTVLTVMPFLNQINLYSSKP